jgi:hypothetical protein
VGQQVQQEGVFASWWVLDQFDQLSSLLCGQGQRGDAEGSALSNVLAIGLQHGVLPWVKNKGQVQTDLTPKKRQIRQTSIFAYVCGEIPLFLRKVFNKGPKK